MSSRSESWPREFGSDLMQNPYFDPDKCDVSIDFGEEGLLGTRALACSGSLGITVVLSLLHHAAGKSACRCQNILKVVHQSSTGYPRWLGCHPIEAAGEHRRDLAYILTASAQCRKSTISSRTEAHPHT